MSWKSLGRKISVIAFAGLSIISIQTPEKRVIQGISTERSVAEIQASVQKRKSKLNLAYHIPSFGFRNVLADISFIQFLQYFGDPEERNRTGYDESADFFKVILKSDPYYLAHYVFLSGSNTLYAGRPEKTVELIDTSLQKLSPNKPADGFYVWRYKAVDELLFLGNSSAARTSYDTAADWAKKSSVPEARFMSEQSRKTANFLASNPDSRNAQIDAWGSLLTTALDDGARIRIIKKIESLGGSVLISEDGGISIRYQRADSDE